MKKLTVLTFFGLIFLASATAFAQINFGVKAGLNLADMNGRSGGEKDTNTRMKIGFNLGGIVNYDFTDVLSLETGLILDSKGYEYRFDNNRDFSSKADYGKLVTNVMYLDIPLSLKAYLDLGNSRIFGQFGPYVGFALFGNIKATGDLKKELESAGFDSKESLEFGNSAANDDLKRFDFGLMLGAGVEISSMEISATYDLGIHNILPGGDSDNYIRNGVLKLSVAYFFEN